MSAAFASLAAWFSVFLLFHSFRKYIIAPFGVQALAQFYIICGVCGI